MQENKQNIRFTALYCRLSSDDELKRGQQQHNTSKNKSYKTMLLKKCLTPTEVYVDDASPEQISIDLYFKDCYLMLKMI